MHNSHQNVPLKILHLNIQAIKNKKERLLEYLVERNIDIASVNETWLNPTISLSSPQYHIIRKDRSIRRGGGVCLLIRKSLNFEQLDLTSFPEEVVGLSITNTSGNRWFFVSVYNEPKNTLTAKLFDHLNLLCGNLVIMGDFNSHHSLWFSKRNDGNGKFLCKLIKRNKWSVHNNSIPTYTPVHRIESHSIIDLVLTNASGADSIKNLAVDEDEDLGSDHSPVLFEVLNGVFGNQTSSASSGSIKSTSWSKFSKLLIKIETNLNIRSNETENDIDHNLTVLESAINTALNGSTSLKIVPNKEPMILPENIIKLIKLKRKARNKFMKTRDTHFKAESNRLNALIIKNIKKYRDDKLKKFCDEVNSLNTSNAQMWRKINSFCGNAQPKSSIKEVQLDDGKVSKDNKEILESFKNKLEKTFETFSGPEYNEPFKKFIESKAKQIFSSKDPLLLSPDQLTTPNEVAKILQEIKGKGAPGIDQITNRCLKQLPFRYIEHISEIINGSLKLSYVPDKWKIALVTMIPKPSVGRRTLNDYRPISLLSTLSKICERVVATRLDKWINELGLISPFQSGFVKGKQTRDQILRLIQNIQGAFNIKHQVGAVFVDKEKAFDRVWHEGLLCKLHSAKIPLYLGKWLKAYLHDRSFVVKLAGESSSTGNITAGVPQGSVLGPKLFNFYFNDIGSAVTKNNNIKIAMFADDFTGWKSSRSPNIIQKQLQQFLDDIQIWCSRWRMKLNSKKTVYNIFTKRRIVPSLNLNYNGQKLNKDQQPKFLGVKLDSRLNFSAHIQSIKEKCNIRINMLKRLSGCKGGIKSNLRLSIYKALVQPIIDYCPFIAICCNNPALRKLDRIQNKAIRAAVKWPMGLSNSKMLKEYKIETIHQRHLRLSQNYLRKAVEFNSIIRQEVLLYQQAKGVIDGQYNHNNRNKKPTVLSKILNQDFTESLNQQIN